MRIHADPDPQPCCLASNSYYQFPYHVGSHLRERHSMITILAISSIAINTSTISITIPFLKSTPPVIQFS
jgi:hypothetical protein